jgi:hypothetical protein
MKRLLIFLSILVFPLLGQTATPPAAGDGSVGDPYQIATMENIYWLTQNSGEWDKHYLLTNDIDASATVTWDGGQGILPIGNSSIAFTGTFDGNNQAISNIYLNRSDLTNIGLFGVANGATIENLNIVSARILGIATYGGILVGTAVNTTITNIRINGTFKGEAVVFGGLIGYANPATITEILVEVAIDNSAEYSGLLTGSSNSPSTHTRCFVAGSIVNTIVAVGGLSGSSFVASYTDCASQLTLADTPENAGGLIGYSFFPSITNCYSASTLRALEKIGGLIGDDNRAGGTFLNSYYDSEISGLSGGYGEAKTTAEMQMQSTFSGWDFSSTWQIDANNYPVLQWPNASDPGPPTVLTLNPSNNGGSEVNLNGVVNPHGVMTDYYFEYTTLSGDYSRGLTTSTASAGDGHSGMNKSLLLNGLALNTTYYLRIVATSDSGTVYGEENSFTTLPVVVSPPTFGDGTQGNPWQLSEPGHLWWLSNNSAFWSDAFELTSDIDITGSENWNDGAGFIPIGSESIPFTGSLNGNHHIINGLSISGGNDVGFFGFLKGSVDSLQLTNAEVSGTSYVGILSGRTTFATVQYVKVSGNLTLEYMYGGLICGRADSSVTIANSAAIGNIYGGEYIGMIFGLGRVDIELTGLSARGTINGESNVGGLAGYLQTANVTDSYADVDIINSGSYTGGFAGLAADTTHFLRCYSAGVVQSAFNWTGGFAGGTLNQPYSATDCYWDIENSGQSDGVGVGALYPSLTGQTTSEMRQESTFSGWDFTSTWRIEEGLSTPYLAWEETPGLAPSVNLSDAYNIGSNSADFPFSINPNGAETTYILKYGNSVDNLNQQTSPAVSVGSGNVAITLERTLSNLFPNTAYFVQLEASNVNGSSVSVIKEIYTAPVVSAPAAGDGSSGNPYVISNLDELAWMMITEESWDKAFALVADIDAAATENWFNGAGFKPIGRYPSTPFTGMFNGKQHTIANLTIKGTDDYTAFWGYASDANIDSLKLTGVNIEGNGSHTAALIAKAFIDTLSAIEIEGEIIGSGLYTGGLAGENNGLSRYTDIDINVTITGPGTSVSSYAGGMFGKTGSSTRIYNSRTCGEISNVYYGGGIIGYSDYGYIYLSMSAMNISARYAGGLIGRFQRSSIEDSYSVGTISGVQTAAGLVPSTSFGNKIFKRCFATGAVSAPSAGGLLQSGFATAYEECFWDTETTGQATSAIGIGKTTSEMQTESTFTDAGWDFSTTWAIDSEGYPYLQWEKPATPEPPSVTTGLFAALTDSSVQLSGSINPRGYETVYFFEYGTTSGVYANQFPIIPDSVGKGIIDLEVTAEIVPLSADQRYYYRLVAINSGGTSYGEERSFRTLFKRVMPSGEGTSPNPYRIRVVNHLLWVSEHSDMWSAHFIMSDNIDASASGSFNSGLGFEPIGTEETPFTGHFDGASHSISNLTINRPLQNYIGFIGHANGATIRNIGLADASISGQNFVGGLVGYADNNTVIEYSFTKGSVSGSNNIGGLVGWLDAASSVKNSYNRASISGNSRTGGVAGFNVAGNIDSTYNAGVINSAIEAGGLVGKTLSGVVTASYWDGNVSGQPTSAGGTKLTTTQMQKQSSFSGWDFSNLWRIFEDNGYPFLMWERFNGSIIIPVNSTGPQTVLVGNQTAVDQLVLNDVETPGNLSVEFWDTQTSSAEGVSGTLSLYFWIIENDGLVIDEEAGYTIRFNLADMTFFGGIQEYNGADPNLSDIRVYKRDTPGSGIFTAVPGFLEYYNNGTIGDQRDDYVISPLITDGFSEFVFATEGDHPLPVELSTFRATGKDRQVELFWKTASELLNSGFNVYRSDSEEGEYQEISSYRYNEDLEGLGTSAHGQDYRFTDNDFRLLNDATYYYKIADVDVNGVVTMHGPVTATPTASEGDEQVARLFKLYPNYPNPFNPTTTIVVDLEEFTDEALIEVYDITGRLVKTLYSGPINQYRIMVEWDGTNNAGNTLSTGMYFYRFRSANRDIMRKMILMK